MDERAVSAHRRISATHRAIERVQKSATVSEAKRGKHGPESLPLLVGSVRFPAAVYDFDIEGG
jgi:hypothetical protein